MAPRARSLSSHEALMKAFHVCRTESSSGISRYAADFHRQVLGPLGYQLMSPTAITPVWIESQPADVTFHVQLGVLQFEERQALSRLLHAGRMALDATLHDPPFLTFPYFPFRSSLMMRLSRGFDWYLGSLGLQNRLLRRLRTVYVLSDRGRSALLSKGAKRVERIPHIVAPESIWPEPVANSSDILYFGFVGPAKGIEYALQLHQRIVKYRPNVRLHIVGDATGNSEKEFLTALKARYTQQVTFHGYVDESKLDSIFVQARHVFLPFEAYRYFIPASGSVINALKRGRVVWSTSVNSVPELIQHRVNGMLLSRNLDEDCRLFLEVSEDTPELDRLARAAIDTAREMSTYPYERHFTIETSP